ncbi:MAG: CDP-alcohol phosphatidyltransferase family protein [Deltaproteobacteria bacterium]|nr:CDP-alcohol phosphatidyltransferase family protein [Deltaproteobacteria bacterium]
MNISEIRNRLIAQYYDILEKCVRPLAQRGVSPNVISSVSLILSFIAALFYAFGMIFMGGITLLLSGFTDTVDGSVARITGQSTNYGALLDSTLDRYAEFFIFFGLIIYFGNGWMVAVVLLALMGSIMVSYIKARAESLGQTRLVGMMQRPERLVLLSLGSLLNTPVGRRYPECPDCVLAVTLILLAVLSNITALQRLISGKKDLKQSE